MVECPLMRHWCPGIDGKSRGCDDRCMMPFVGESREEGARLIIDA